MNAAVTTILNHSQKTLPSQGSLPDKIEHAFLPHEMETKLEASDFQDKLQARKLLTWLAQASSFTVPKVFCTKTLFWIWSFSAFRKYFDEYYVFCWYEVSFSGIKLVLDYTRRARVAPKELFVLSGHPNSLQNSYILDYDP